MAHFDTLRHIATSRKRGGLLTLYKECVTCKRLGKTCQGPNFSALDAAGVVSWCKARKNYLGLSNGKLAEMAELPKGTIDGLFGSAHMDFRYETIRPILNTLIGGVWSGPPCRLQGSPGEIEKLQSRIRHLEADVQQKDERIKSLHEERSMRQDNMQANYKQQERNDAILYKEIRRKNRAISILAVIVGLLLVVIIAALIADLLNDKVGFFWLRSLLSPSGQLEPIKNIALKK